MTESVEARFGGPGVLCIASAIVPYFP